jgi:hypothetical protein
MGYMLAILRNTEQERKKIFISYEQLLEDPLAICRRLAHFLDQHCSTATTASTTVEAMANAIDRRFWRNRSEKQFQDAPQATTAQKALYEFLQIKVADANALFESKQFPLFPVWRRYLEDLTSLNPLDDYMW